MPVNGHEPHFCDWKRLLHHRKMKESESISFPI
jgi:hypothetical protein